MAEIIEFDSIKRTTITTSRAKRLDRILLTAHTAVTAIMESLDSDELSGQHAMDLAVLTYSLAELFEQISEEINSPRI